MYVTQGYARLPLKPEVTYKLMIDAILALDFKVDRMDKNQLSVVTSLGPFVQDTDVRIHSYEIVCKNFTYTSQNMTEIFMRCSPLPGDRTANYRSEFGKVASKMAELAHQRNF